MSRVTTARLAALAGELPARERLLVETVSRLRLVSHAQLATLLLFDRDGSDLSSASAARGARRILARLTELRVLARLGRRVGGIRAGSAGYLYYLGPVGQRLVAYWQGRGLTRGRFRPDPSGRHVRHRLAVSEVYIQARQAEAAGILELLGFDCEPDCWRAFTGALGERIMVKPDAYIRVGAGAYEDRYLVEVDLGTESREVIAHKLRVYLDYWRSGSEQADHGVFPRILLLTSTQARQAALVEVCSRLPAETWELFAVTTLDQGMGLISGLLDDEPTSTGGHDHRPVVQA